jgi:hypothetical protein
MLEIRCFNHEYLCILVIVSYFVLKDFEFLTEKMGFSVKH